MFQSLQISLLETVSTSRHRDDFGRFSKYFVSFHVRFIQRDSEQNFTVFTFFVIRRLILTPFSVFGVRSNGLNKSFPGNFIFGVSSAAYQIEGAWNVDGKGPSIWDEFTHSHPEKMADGQNGDISASSYEFFEEDIKAVKNLNVKTFLFYLTTNNHYNRSKINIL